MTFTVDWPLNSRGHSVFEHSRAVLFQEADVIIGALTVTAEREEVVDFTLPYYDFAGIQILMRKPDTNVNLFYFVDVFTTEAWLCLFGVIILTSILLFVFERFSPKGEESNTKGGGKEGDSELPKAFDLKESIWFVIGSVTLAGECHGVVLCFTHLCPNLLLILKWWR